MDVHPLLPQAVALHQKGHLEEAAKLYLKISESDPQNFDATHLLGVAALQQGRFEVAQSLILRALGINPQDVPAMGNLGTSYLRGGQLQAALLWFDLALKLQPESSNAILNMANVLHSVGRYRNAIPLLRRASAADPHSYTVCSLLGSCLLKAGKPREAAEMFEAATRAQPWNAEGLANLATARRAAVAAPFDRDEAAETVGDYGQELPSPAPTVQMLLSYANAQLASGLNSEAIEQLKRATKLDPNNLNARWAAVIAHLRPVYQSSSEIVASRLAFAQSLNEIETWYDGASNVSEPFNAVGVCQPFFLAYQPYNNRELLTRYGALCATWMSTLPGTEPDSNLSANLSTAHRKLRVGIASAQISEHSVWNAITRGWVLNLDRTKFEITLFHLGPAADEETQNARRAVAHFEDRATSIAEWVDVIRKQHLDVLIYPEIGMHPLTCQLAAARLAPVQATAWGHPETSGLPTMDLYISADQIEPADPSSNYSEKLITLPNLGVYVEPLVPAVVDVDVRSLNLPSDQPLLLCPGSPFKYSPVHDEVWVRIAKQLRKKFLKRNSGGRLVFFRSRSSIMDRIFEGRLRAVFDRAEVNFDEHVSIIPNLDRPRFFGLMRKSALMLDTLEFSGFNTAVQAIECDLPVLAYEGQFMRGRLASGTMRHMGLPELVAQTLDEFVHKAIELAENAGRRAKLRNEIVDRRHVLFEDLAPVRALELHLIEAVADARC